MMCQKIVYLTKSAAAADARHIETGRNHFSKKFGSDRKRGRRLRPYNCKVCGLWHLSTRGKLKYE